MSEWNLSVRLTGQGSDLTGTLRDSAKEARKLTNRINEAKQALTELRAAAAGDITVRLDIDADHLRSDVSAALTTAGSGQGLSVRLDVDAADLHSEVQAALTGASGQGLSVRLDLDAGDLRADVDAALLGAGSGQGITVRLDVDGAHLRDDVTAALTAASGQGLTARLDIDAGHLHDDVSAALAAASGQGLSVRLDVDAGHLRDDVEAALTAAGAGQGLRVDLQLGNAMQLRRDVENAVRWAAWGHRIEIPLRLRDPMQLRRDVSDAVRWASMNQTITVRVTPDTSALNGLTNTINSGGSSGGGAKFGLSGFLPFATAAIPLAGGLAASMAPLAGIFAATAGGAAAFGIALAGQIGPLSEVAEAEKAYQDALQEHGRASAEAITAQLTYQRKLAALPPETQKAAIALSSLETEFSDWSDEMAGFTMSPVTKGFTILQELLPSLTPEVESFSGEMDRLMDVAGGAISTPGFDAFSGKVAALTDQKLDSFTDQVIHLLRVVSEGDAGGGAIGQILTYMRQNAPAAREAVDALGDAVSTLAEGASDAGPTMLTLVTAVARLVGALPPELIGILLQVAAGLKLIQLAAAGSVAAAAAVARLGTSIQVLGARSAAAGGGLAGLRAAIAGLSTGAKVGLAAAGIGALVLALHELSDNKPAVQVDELSTSLNTLLSTGEMTGALKSNFQEMSDSIAMVSKGASDNKLAQMTSDFGTWIGISTGPGISTARKNVDAWDKSMAALVKSGNTKQAAAQYELLKKAWVAGGGDLDRLKKFTTDYQDAQADVAFEQEMAAQSMGLFGQAALDTQAKLDAQKQSADGLRQSIQALNDVNRAGGSAMAAFEQSLDDVAKATSKHASSLKMSGGELDLGTGKAREAEKVLSGLAANTDAAAAAAREQGKSWQHVSGIYTEGRDAFVKAADAMGLTREQAEALADSYLKIPDKKSTVLEMRTEDAVAGLDSVVAAIEKTPDAKSVTVSALTDDAVTMLEELGFKVTELPNGQFQVSAETGTAKTNLEDLKVTRDGLQDKTIKLNADKINAIDGLNQVIEKIHQTPNAKSVTVSTLSATAIQALRDVGFTVTTLPNGKVTVTAATGTALGNIGSVQAARDALSDKSITITTVKRTVMQTIIQGPSTTADALRRQAAGFAKADGGVVDYYADGGIQRGGVRRFATGAENHVAQIAPGGSWRVWAEDETQGESYIPLARSKRPRSRAITEETVRRLGGNPQSIEWNASGNVTDWRYDPTSGSLYSASDAGSAGHKTKKVKVKGKTKEIEYFDVSAVEKKLISAGKATAAWNRNLEKVADLAGGDVADALAAMGKDGVALTKKMANGSKKYIAQMSIALRDLAKTARASLTDYKVQLNHATGNQELFAKNLAKLAAQGFGDLAGQLAAQNDVAAQQLAATAVKDKNKAAGANTAAKRANSALTAEQIEDLVAIIAAVKTKATGIHDVAATTGLGEDEIVDTATKASSQIKTALGSRAARFLADLAKAQKGMAYASGGIRSGIYATRGGAVTFAEPSTGGEAYIPLGAGKRRSAMPVLSDVAARFGKGLTDGNAGRIINNYYNSSQSVTSNVSGVGNAADVARRVADADAYQLRRFKRGGVGARG